MKNENFRGDNYGTFGKVRGFHPLFFIPSATAHKKALLWVESALLQVLFDPIFRHFVNKSLPNK